jgi:hypothetical protein
MPEKTSKFHVVVVEEGQPAIYYQYNDYNPFRAFLLELFETTPNGRRQVFVFTGSRWGITASTPHYLISPAGNSSPLFDIQPIGEGREDGVTDWGAEDTHEAPDPTYKDITHPQASPALPTPFGTDDSDDSL